VSARIQHQGGLQTIGRTTSGTLKITATKAGLKYEVKPPNTSAGRDIVELIRRGDISKSSFAFSLRGDPDTAQSWDFTTAPPTRYLHRVNLHDVAPVDGPAYMDTSVGVRAFEQAKRAVETAPKVEPAPVPSDPKASVRETVSNHLIWLKKNREAAKGKK
jgi:HK97 family phage prohead protease